MPALSRSSCCSTAELSLQVYTVSHHQVLVILGGGFLVPSRMKGFPFEMKRGQVQPFLMSCHWVDLVSPWHMEKVLF